MNPDEEQVHKQHQKSGNNRKTKETKLKNLRAAHQPSQKATALRTPKNDRFKIRKAAQLSLTTAKLPVLKITSSSVPSEVVSIIGPKSSGKTQVAQQLISYYTQTKVDPIGPVTFQLPKKRLTILDVPSDLPSVLDAARVSSLVLIVINQANGIETDVFEYLNIFQAVGFPKVFAVFTHFDSINKISFKLKQIKKLRQRVEKEIFKGCKCFFLDYQSSAYKRDQIATLGRTIEQQNYPIALSFRQSHACVLCDRVEKRVNGEVQCFGYVHNNIIQQKASFHIPGFRDVEINSIDELEDPLKQKKTMNKEVQLYAPMSAVNDVKIDDFGVHVKIVEKQTPGRRGKQESAIFTAAGDNNQPGAQGHENLELFEGEEIVTGSENRAEGRAGDEASNEADNEEESFEADEVGSEPQTEFGPPAGLEPQAGSESSQNAAGYTKLQHDLQQNPDAAQAQSFESTSTDLDEFEAEEQAFAQEEEELQAMDLENEKERVEQHLRRLNLVKSQASQQHYYDLIYNYEKPAHVKKNSKQAIMNLFGDEDDQDCVDLTTMPAGFPEPYKTFEDDSSRLIPAQFAYQCGKEVKFTYEAPQYLSLAFVTSDVDFATALDACLNAKAPEPDVQAADGTTHDGKPAGAANGAVTVDSAYQDTLQRQIDAARQREALLSQGYGLNSRQFAPGAYVSFAFKAPAEFVANYRPQCPLILGQLLPEEAPQQYVTARVKRHRWFGKILKSRNPVIFAVGWRRFQSLPFYAQEDEKDVRNIDSKAADALQQLRMLKYTPEFTFCDAVFWGYGAPQSTGIIAFQSFDGGAFRVCLTGSVLETNVQHNVVKKLKLVGYPTQITGKSCLVEKMFTSRQEAGAFCGAEVRTVSGNRGLLKVAQSDGVCRCKFEEKPRISDIIVLKTFVKVKIDKLLIDYDNFMGQFQGVRTVAEIKRDKGLAIEYKAESEYRREEKEVFIKPELKVNQKLLKALPFEKQLKYMDEKQQAQKNVRDGFMKALVKGQREAQRDEILQLAKKVQAKNEQESAQQRTKEAYDQKKWQEGMDRKKEAAKAEKRNEERKRKRAILGRQQQGVLKRGKI